MRRFLPFVIVLGAAGVASAERPQADLSVDSLVVTSDGVRARVVNRGSGAAPGCNVDLRVFDHVTHRATGLSRRGAVGPLAPGAAQAVTFPFEAEFAGKAIRLTVDSVNRVAESDERNNVSTVVRAPLPRRPATPVPEKTVPPPAPVDPAQRSIDLVAESVSSNGITVKGVVRNRGNDHYWGERKAILSREAIGSAHVLDRADIAAEPIPELAQGEEFVIEAPRPPYVKDARKYVYRLRLSPADLNPGNDVASKTVEMVRID